MTSVLTMGYTIDPRSAVPSYRQLADQLAADIRAGQYDGPLPSLTRLQQETGLAVMTIRRSIQLLVDEGLAVTVPGRGTFVRWQAD